MEKKTLLIEICENCYLHPKEEHRESDYQSYYKECNYIILKKWRWKLIASAEISKSIKILMVSNLESTHFKLSIRIFSSTPN